MKIIILIFSLLVFSLMITPQAFAISAGTEYTPTQPNAVASYDAIKNQIQVSWDFNTLPADTTCLLKGDFWYSDDLNTNYSDESPSVSTYVKSFTPLFYSPVTSTPVPIQAVGNDPDVYAEKVLCTGEMRIDLDTVMSHSQNINNFEDLEIFLTFYTAMSNGDFSTSSKYRIDEVFVFYTPIYTFDTGAKNYACGGQIGSTLYIDKNDDGSVGIHGNNGDNCAQYLPLQSTQWVDIGMTDSGIKGKATYGFQSVSALPLTKVIVPTSEETPKKGGGCSGDCTKPTFFKNKAGAQIVKNGFEFNSNATDVIGYHTPYDLITVNTNQTYNMKLKVYETNTLKWIGVYFGLPEIGSPLGDAESEAIFHLNYDKEIEKIVTVDKHTLIDIVRSNMTMTSCGYTSSDCYELDFDFVFRDSLQNNVVGIQAVDRAQNSATHYINDGIKPVGESMNVPLISQVTASNGGAFYPQERGMVELISLSYKYDLWYDKYGYLWTGDGSKSFKIISIIPVPLKEPDVTWFSMTRMNSHFSDIIQYEKNRAVLVFDASKLLNEVGGSFAYDLPQSEEEYYKELAIKLEIEAERATKKTKDYS